MCFIVILSILPMVLGVFKSLPTTVKTHENDTVLLPCYLDGTGTEETGGVALSIRWLKDGELMADTANSSITVTPDRFKIWENGSLEVLTVQHEDTGEYLCEVVRRSPWGSITQVHAIEVLYPPSVEMDPASGLLQVKLGEEVRISCTGSGVPFPLITWRSRGEEIQLLDNRQILKFKATNRFLSGEYECIASNGVGHSAKAKLELNIIYPPDITQDKSWIHTSPGLRAALECSVAADPPAEVTWFKSNTPVTLDTRVIALVDGEKHSLIIRNVRISDFGIYKCSAENDLGSAEVEIQLSGVANPGMFKQIEQKDLEKAKNSYMLVWEVDSYSPIIEYNLWFRLYKAYTIPTKPEWTKLTIPAQHSSGSMHSKAYTITGLKEKTVYEAMLFSRNRYGWSKPSKVMRFSTEGTELEAEIITQIHVQENIIPTDFIQDQMVSATVMLKFSNTMLVILLLMYIIKINE